MKLTPTLALFDMPRSTFTTLHQNGDLQFLTGAKRDFGWDFSPADQLGLAAFLRLRSMGVAPSLINHALCQGRETVEAAASDDSNGSAQIGIYEDAAGDTGFIGTSGVIDGPEGEIICRATVRLAPLMRHLRTLLSANVA